MGVLVVDSIGVIAFLNSAAERMFLYDRSQWEGQPIEMLVPAAGRSEHRARVGAFIETPVCRPMGASAELTALRRDGTQFPVEIGLSPLITTEGTWVIASILDITERKHLARTVREQHERTQAYWEAASEGLITVDVSGAIEVVNQATERMFGYDRSELVGQPLEMLIPEVHRRAHSEKRESYFSEPKLRPMGMGRDFSGRRKDGTDFPVEVGLNVARIGDRTIAVGFITDISEKRRLQEQAAVLGTLVDLEQQLATTRREGASSDSDPLTGLNARASFSAALGRASSGPEGLYAVVYSIQRMRQMTARWGTKTADRIVVFASQYIRNTLQGEGDQLFRWDGSTFVSLVKRDSSGPEVQGEVTEACRRRLVVEFEGGNSMVMIALAVKVLPLAQTPFAEVVAEIEQFAGSALRA
jgi:PAS domain S-box-containing protein